LLSIVDIGRFKAGFLLAALDLAEISQRDGS